MKPIRARSIDDEIVILGHTLKVGETVYVDFRLVRAIQDLRARIEQLEKVQSEQVEDQKGKVLAP